MITSSRIIIMPLHSSSAKANQSEQRIKLVGFCAKLIPHYHQRAECLLLGKEPTLFKLERSGNRPVKPRNCFLESLGVSEGEEVE